MPHVTVSRGSWCLGKRESQARDFQPSASCCAARAHVNHTPPPQLPHNQHTMASHDAPTILTTAQAQFTLADNARHTCRHCGLRMSNQRVSTLKQHLAWCKSLPGSVRVVLDHAAVCESRACVGSSGGRHASVYRGFRVTGCGVMSVVVVGRLFEAGVGR